MVIFENIASLKGNTVIPQANETATLLGYTTAGDGGGGDFYWDSNATDADNAGTVIMQSNSVTGRWKRIFSDYVSIKWFGAVCDANPVTGAGTDDTLAIQRAVEAWSNVSGKGNTRITAPIVFRFASSSIDFVNLTVFADGCTAYQLGDSVQKVGRSVFNFGSIFGAAVSNPRYVNSGVLVKNSIQSRIYCGTIQFFENGVDFYPAGTTIQDGNSAAENYVFASISRCINGIRIRKTGTGTQEINPVDRGWCEGNVLNGGIFGCDKGLFIEQDALATFTKLQGLTIDCASGSTGSASLTSLDIDARIYNAIIGEAKYLRPGKSSIVHPVTSKIFAIPIDEERLLSENICLNPLFLVPGTAASGVFGWNATLGSLTRNSDGSVRFTLSQPGQRGGGLDGHLAINPAGNVGTWKIASKIP